MQIHIVEEISAVVFTRDTQNGALSQQIHSKQRHFKLFVTYLYSAIANLFVQE